jgi:hypothetical protein
LSQKIRNQRRGSHRECRRRAEGRYSFSIGSAIILELAILAGKERRSFAESNCDDPNAFALLKPECPFAPAEAGIHK